MYSKRLSTSVISESSCGTKTTAYPRAPAAPRRLVYRRTTLVEGQPGSPSTVGPRLLGRHPWVPAQKSSTVGPHDQFSLLRALGNQTKLSTFDTVAFRVRRRPDRFHARCGRAHCILPARNLETLTIWVCFVRHSLVAWIQHLSVLIDAEIEHLEVHGIHAMDVGRQPSNQLRGSRDAAAHACSTGLSTGHHLMPMKARCCAATPCRGAATVRQLPTRGEWWEAAVCVELTDVCTCSGIVRTPPTDTAHPRRQAPTPRTHVVAPAPAVDACRTIAPRV